MRLSRYFLPTLRETPSDAQIVSHRLMLRAGLIHQVTSGIYAWLPLGLRVLNKIRSIVAEEQEHAGSIELMMPTIQPADLWRKSGRYEDYGKEMLCFKDRHEREMLYGPTAEEVITDIFHQHVRSYRDLPKRLFNIQWKFRDEVRPRFGVMRGREFLMKDNYSFDLDAAGAKRSYEIIFESYLRTFQRIGLRAIPVKADTGPIGGDLSHEFHILASTGESMLYYDAAFDSIQQPLSLAQANALYAVADDKHDPEHCPIPPENLRTARGIEVGHIFYFGTKYSEPLGAYVTDRTGQQVPVEMGSYGIGISRLVGAVIEAFHDEKGIIWPSPIAPFQVALINLKTSDASCTTLADQLYTQMQEKDSETLYDDRQETPGVKLSDMDLIGIPFQVIVGPRAVAENLIEVKQRSTGKIEKVNPEKGLELMLSHRLGELFDPTPVD